MHYLSEQNIFIFLLQIAILLAVARGLGELFRKWKQSALTAEILVGVFFGPTILGRFFPGLYQNLFPKDIIQQNMLETIAWVGVLFLLLETGLEVDFASAWRQGLDALKIAITDIIIPMIVAFIPCYFLLPDYYLGNPEERFLFASFMATAMTISAMPVAVRVLQDLKLSKTDLGFLIMSALSINDVIGWVIFTLVLGAFTEINPDFGKIFTIAGVTILFTIICFSIGRKMVDKIIVWMKRSRISQPAGALSFVCVLGALCGAITQKMGIHALFGFFIAGIMAGSSKSLSEHVRQIISQMVHSIFVPLFFVNIGLKIDFFSNFAPLLVMLITVIGISGRFLGAWIGTSFTTLPKRSRLIVSVAHIPGGAMEVVVGLLALEYKLITEPVFVAIVFSALISSIIMGPWLSILVKQRKKMRLSKYIFEDNIIFHISNDEINKVILELITVIANNNQTIDKEKIYKMLIEREQGMGTALEDGVAVPHARIRGIRKPIIAFGRSVTGIEWDAPDGKLIKFIFLILTPERDYDSQVQILASIADIMSKPEIKEAILRAENRYDLAKIFSKV